MQEPNMPVELNADRPADAVADQPAASTAGAVEAPATAKEPNTDGKFDNVGDLPPRVKVPGTEAEIVVDDEFRKLLRRLRKDELKELEKNLQDAGRARDKLVVWKQEGILMDGHHRLLLCLKYQLPFEVEGIDLPDRETALQWMRKHQLGKRNLTPKEQEYQRGKLYNQSKQKKGGDRKSAGKVTGGTGKEVAEALAKKDGVSVATVLRDGKFTDDVDKIVAYHGEDVKALLIGDEAKLNRKEVSKLAALDPKKQKEVIEEVKQTGRWERSPAPKDKAGSPTASLEQKLSGASNADKGKENTTPTSSVAGDDKKVKRLMLVHEMKSHEIAERLFKFFATEKIKGIDGYLQGMLRSLSSKKGSAPMAGFLE